MTSKTPATLRTAAVSPDMTGDEFRRCGHELVDRIGEFLDGWEGRAVTVGSDPAVITGALPQGELARQGTAADALVTDTAELLFEHSLFNGHPRFFGYITSSAAPLGALADMLAAAVNPNLGGWELSPVASEIERQAVRWIAELIGFPADCAGTLVSGGNVANFSAFLAARRAHAGAQVRERGLREGAQMTVYVSRETHTWIQKAADLFGLGTDAIRWIEVDAQRRLDVAALRRRVRDDREAGMQPFLVVGTAGTVGVGAVDPLRQLAQVSREEGLWFHVDGAYGAPAAALPEADADLAALSLADSVAIDPHKWLYSPLEAGCVLVRDRRALGDAFAFRPEYYAFDDSDTARTNFHELGFQNSRGFRALKVWMGLRQLGRDGVVERIREDIALAGELHRRAIEHPEIDAATYNLSISTFRYVPAPLAGDTAAHATYLNDLNLKLLHRLQAGGEVYLSNAVVDGTFLLRACVVNFRTLVPDVVALLEVVVRRGRELDAELRGDGAASSSVVT